MTDVLKELRQLQANGRTSSLRALAMEAADEIERLRKDAERYRWLRVHCKPEENQEADAEDFDSAVDACLKLDAAMEKQLRENALDELAKQAQELGMGY